MWDTLGTGFGIHRQGLERTLRFLESKGIQGTALVPLSGIHFVFDKPMLSKNVIYGLHVGVNGGRKFVKSVRSVKLTSSGTYVSYNVREDEIGMGI